MSTARADLHGDPLAPFALARHGTIRWRHQGLTVEDVTFSADGTTVFSSGTGLTAFDVSTGLPRWSRREPAINHTDLLRGPSGDAVVTVGFRGAASFFDAATGEAGASFALPASSLVTVAVSHDAETIAAGGFTRYGALLRRDGSVRATLPVEGGLYLHSASFSPDDRTLVTTDAQGRVVLWSVDEARAIRVIGDDGLEPNDAVFTPDGAQLLVATSHGNLVLYDVATGAQLARWKAHPSSASSVVITHDGLRAVSAGEDGTLSHWRIRDHTRLGTMAIGGMGTALCLSPDGSAVALGRGPRVLLVDLASFTERAPTTDADETVQSLVIGRDDETVVSLSTTRPARWWSMTNGALRCAHAVEAGGTALRALPEGDRYAVMQPAHKGTPVIDVAAGTVSMRPESWADTHQKWWGTHAHATLFQGRTTLTNARGESRALKVNSHHQAITADDRYAVWIEPSKVTVWDLGAHAPAAVVPMRSCAGLSLSPRGDVVAVWTSGALRWLSLPDGALRAEWKSPKDGGIQAAAWSRDGARFAVSIAIDARVFEGVTFEEIARLAGHGSIVSAIALDADGGRVVTGSWDSTAVVWSVAEAIAGRSTAPAAKPAKKPANKPAKKPAKAPKRAG